MSPTTCRRIASRHGYARQVEARKLPLRPLLDGRANLSMSSQPRALHGGEFRAVVAANRRLRRVQVDQRMELRREALPEQRDASRSDAPVVKERRQMCAFCSQRGDHPTPAHCLRTLER